MKGRESYSSDPCSLTPASIDEISRTIARKCPLWDELEPIHEKNFTRERISCPDAPERGDVIPKDS